MLAKSTFCVMLYEGSADVKSGEKRGVHQDRGTYKVLCKYRCLPHLVEALSRPEDRSVGAIKSHNQAYLELPNP